MKISEMKAGDQALFTYQYDSPFGDSEEVIAPITIDSFSKEGKAVKLAHENDGPKAWYTIKEADKKFKFLDSVTA